ncbi:FKBP-type peptidyl-prolyl cis-trans isomerase [Carpediemonas membranifera]|uniref:peptidylprolyl isomerase n=1 Tax=Carpediemonas membranifera TaxID=201153 RepID=A0A8J6B0V7_9EUKA|nr:FKBP-type peptidyl-prolyl cis-trans isomerase [Carpediemonas membranifera]|eukprot:KAG9396905.1 FKBP-type peptidyl-prolyl cis-trans isomerase [Carpediemonas membranifera]
MTYQALYILRVPANGSATFDPNMTEYDAGLTSIGISSTTTSDDINPVIVSMTNVDNVTVPIAYLYPGREEVVYPMMKLEPEDIYSLGENTSFSNNSPHPVELVFFMHNNIHTTRLVNVVAPTKEELEKMREEEEEDDSADDSTYEEDSQDDSEESEESEEEEEVAPGKRQAAPTKAEKKARHEDGKDGIAEGPNGLRYKDDVVGTGATVGPRSKVSIEYVGRLAKNNKEFDRSNKGSPMKFKLGREMVIDGIEQGIVGMRVGGKRTIIIPSPLGYGKQGAPPVIPPNANLVFEVKIVDSK